MKVERSYPFIGFISVLHKILAVITLVAGLCIGFMGRGMESFMGFVGGTLGCISLIAFSELLNLFVDIEGNTRRTANLLDKEEVKKEVSEVSQQFVGSIGEEYAERVRLAELEK